MGGPMIASVQIANVSLGSALSVVRRAPEPARVAGLRHATVAVTAPLSASILAKPDFRRVALISFWDGDAALDHFVAHDRMAATLAGGWSVRLEPLRAHGSWPGLPPEITSARAVEHEGPVAALTLGRLRISQAVRFVRTSAKAEASVLDAPGLIWATGLARPPF